MYGGYYTTFWQIPNTLPINKLLACNIQKLPLSNTHSLYLSSTQKVHIVSGKLPALTQNISQALYNPLLSVPALML